MDNTNHADVQEPAHAVRTNEDFSRIEDVIQSNAPITIDHQTKELPIGPPSLEAVPHESNSVIVSTGEVSASVPAIVEQPTIVEHVSPKIKNTVSAESILVTSEPFEPVARESIKNNASFILPEQNNQHVTQKEASLAPNPPTGSLIHESASPNEISESHLTATLDSSLNEAMARLNANSEPVGASPQKERRGNDENNTDAIASHPEQEQPENQIPTDSFVASSLPPNIGVPKEVTTVENTKISGSSERHPVTKAPIALPENSSPASSSSMGFLASLNATFTSETTSAWAQLFGSRYEDEDDAQNGTNQVTISRNQTIPNDNSRSLRAKFERERKLDEQIKRSQQQYRDRIRRRHELEVPATNTTRTNKSARTQNTFQPATTTISPFEKAGISLTRIRFSAEKALRETCRCFHQLHAIASNTTANANEFKDQGVYITVWELEQLLHELFDPHGLNCSALSSQQPTSYTDIKLEMLLEVSWFLPFDQLSRLRSIVFQITRKHLNENKLSIVNRRLQKELLLLPHSARLQQFLVNFSDLQAGILGQHWSTPTMLHQFLICISIFVPLDMIVALDGVQFMTLSPFELVNKLKLSNMLCIQRLMFFRFFLEALAIERTNKDESPPSPVRRSTLSTAAKAARTTSTSSKQSSAKKTKSTRRKAREKRISPSTSPSDYDDEESKKMSEDDNNAISTTQRSPVSTSVTLGSSTSGNSLTTVSQPKSIPYDWIDKLKQLQEQLRSSLNRLERVIPSLLTAGTNADDNVSPVVHTAYLSASDFNQSLDIMITSQVPCDYDVVDKLEHFIRSIDSIIDDYQQKSSNSSAFDATKSPDPAVVASCKTSKDTDEPYYPPPYPESTASEILTTVADEQEQQPYYPPPYVSTGPAYWAFSPTVPPPTSHSKPLHCDSPGVGAYNIVRSDHLIYQQKHRYSFGAVSTKDKSPQSKSRVYKTSLAQTPTSSTSYPATSTSSPCTHQPQAAVSTQRESTDRRNMSSSANSSDIYDNFTSRVQQAFDEPQATEDSRLVTEIRAAMRQQQKMVVDEFVHNVIHKHQRQPQQYLEEADDSEEEESFFVHRQTPSSCANHRGTPNQRANASSTPSQTNRSHSRFVNRLRQREVTETIDVPLESLNTSTKDRTLRSRGRHRRSTSPSLNGSYKQRQTKIATPQQPALEQERNDDHMAWAARIRDFYRTKTRLEDQEVPSY